jgi:hypothetical protein
MLGSAAEPGRYVQMALSPDERRLALQIDDSAKRGSDIWQLDLSTRVLSRVTAEAMGR